jgi:MoaA/NifB/PqqE/SkfB family radical SAM enzyme
VDGINITPEFDVKNASVFHINNYANIEKYGNMLLKHESNFSTGKKYCRAGSLYYTIKPNGEVTVCPHKLMLSIGSIKNNTLKDILTRDKSDEEINEISSCSGCFAKCTTEIPMIFEQNIFQLMRSFPKLVKSQLGFRLK